MMIPIGLYDTSTDKSKSIPSFMSSRGPMSCDSMSLLDPRVSPGMTDDVDLPRKFGEEC